MPREDFNDCVFVCDQQDDFPMEAQMRFQSEITQRCLANASRSHLAADASETLPAEADGRADSTAAACARAHARHAEGEAG